MKSMRIVPMLGLLTSACLLNAMILSAMDDTPPVYPSSPLSISTSLSSRASIAQTDSGSESSLSSPSTSPLSSPGSTPNTGRSSNFGSPLSSVYVSFSDDVQENKIAESLINQWNEYVQNEPNKAPGAMFYNEVLKDAVRTEDKSFQNACKKGDIRKIHQFLNACNLTDTMVEPQKLETLHEMLAYFKVFYRRYNVRYAFVNNAQKLATLHAILTNNNVVQASPIKHTQGAALITTTDINNALFDATQEHHTESTALVKYLMSFTFNSKEKSETPHYIHPNVLKAAHEYLASREDQETLEEEFDGQLKLDQARQAKQDKNAKPAQKHEKAEQLKTKKFDPKTTTRGDKTYAILPG